MVACRRGAPIRPVGMGPYADVAAGAKPVAGSLPQRAGRTCLAQTHKAREKQSTSETLMPDPLSPDLLGKMHAYWRAANYLSVGQIYLQDNPLLESPLRLEHIKPRLLGHWGTTPGLNFLYVHLNRLIKENDLNMMYVIGPGHGGPGLVAQTYLEGSYTEHYPAIERSRNGLHRLFRQFPGLTEFPVTYRRKLPVLFTKAENWAIH